MKSPAPNALNPMPEVEYQMMAQLESSLWWYRALHAHVANALMRHSVPSNAEILDLGCGTGGLLKCLKQQGFSNARGIDINHTALSICRERGLRVDYGSIGLLTPIASSSVDVVISNDVLTVFPVNEFPSILDQMSRILKNDGLLMMNLPARAIFSGAHDKAVHNVSRIVVRDFELNLINAGFEICQSFGWPFMLSPLILLTRLIQRVRLLGGQQSEVVSDVKPINPAINRFFEFITVLESSLPVSLRQFGSSQFFICRKRGC